jgi:nucleotide-binding universal stress UspA family protein
MFETILVTTDGSENAARAAAVAGNLAATYDALLVIVHVAPLFVGLNEITEGPQARHLPEKVRGDIEALQTQMGGWEQTPFAQVPAPPSAVAFLSGVIADEAEDIARKQGAKNIERMVSQGDPAAEIVAEATRRKAGLIVLGSHGHGNLKNLVMGSVSHKVLQLADCPCVIVK